MNSTDTIKDIDAKLKVIAKEMKDRPMRESRAYVDQINRLLDARLVAMKK